jgi:outer membrane protein assembly factor BamB
LIFTEPTGLGDDLFANCLIALNAETGERIWHFQGVTTICGIAISPRRRSF